MSFISSVATSSLFATTVPTTTTSSLRPFANLDLTEAQRTQIRAIFQHAKSQGLTQTQIQQQINAILTPAQQATLQNDIAQVQSQSTIANASGNASSSTSAATSPSTPPNAFADPNGPFANLNLTTTQQSQIAQILQSAKSQHLSFAQINAQISALLTTTQQTAFAADLTKLAPSPDADGADPVANLDLTDTQKSQIDQVLQSAQAGTITQSEALAQITSLLTPAQQTALQSDEQTAQTQSSGRRHDSDGDGSTSTISPATLTSGVTETDIQNQVAAATSIILNQLQHDVANV